MGWNIKVIKDTPMGRRLFGQLGASLEHEGEHTSELSVPASKETVMDTCLLFVWAYQESHVLVRPV